MSYPGISARPASLSRSPIATLDNKPKKKKSSHDPSWDVAEDVNSLPEVPFLHIPSMTYAIVGEENPRDIASRIVDAAVALSSVGNYNDEKVSKRQMNKIRSRPSEMHLLTLIHNFVAISLGCCYNKHNFKHQNLYIFIQAWKEQCFD